MLDGKDKSRAHSAALLAAIRKRPGTFKDVFERAWPVFRRSHAGGEDLARLQSYDLLYQMIMRGQLNKINRVYVEVPVKNKPKI